MYRPFWMRILGVGSIVVKGSDQFTNTFVIYGVDDIEEFEDGLQDVIKDKRKEMGMKEYEVYQM
jgi:hypothetical protein